MSRLLDPDHDPGPPDDAPPKRRSWLRVVIGCLLGAAVFLGVGVLIEATGGG